MRGRARLIPLQLIMPESFLPPGNIDDRNLNRSREALQFRLQRKHLNQLLGVGRTIRLDQNNGIRLVLEGSQRFNQLLPRPAANTIPTDRQSLGTKHPKLLRIHLGILIIIDNHRGMKPLLGQAGDQLFQESGFAGTEKTDQKDKGRHASLDSRGGKSFIFNLKRILLPCCAENQQVVEDFPLGLLARAVLEQ